MPGTKIITGGWKAYNNFEQEGYIHDVNHSIEFINNDHPEINMQKIERLWKSLKNELKRECKPGDCNMYIFQFIYFHQQKTGAVQHHDRYLLTFLYCYCVPGCGKQGLRPVTYASNQKIEVCDE